jgi:hypothetical protein
MFKLSNTDIQQHQNLFETIGWPLKGPFTTEEFFRLDVLSRMLIMLYLNFNSFIIHKIEANIVVCPFFSGKNLSLKISTI